VRRTSIRAACLVMSVVGIDSGRAAAQSQIDPPPPIPQPRQQSGSQVYGATYRQSFGTPNQPVLPQNNPNAQWPQQPSSMYPPRPQAMPQNQASGPVMPAGGTSPANARPVLNPLATVSPSAVQPVAYSQPTYPGQMPMQGGAQTPNLLVEKRAPETVLFGQPLSYEIVIRNQGATPVYHVRVEDELPHGVRYLGGEPMAEMGQNRIGWMVGTIEPNSERRMRVDLQPQGEGEIRSVASVTFTTAAVMRTQVVQPRLMVAVRAPEQAIAGENIPFQILVSNPGTGAVNGLILRGKLTPGLQHPQGAVVEAEMGPLGPGETKPVTLTVKAVGGGAQMAEITASADGLESSARASVQVLEAALKLKRTGPPKCFVKSEVGFELEVTNPGSAVATGVQIMDTLPAGLDFVSASEGGTWDVSTRTISWRLNTVPPGGRSIVAYRVKAREVGEQPHKAVVQAERGGEAKAESIFNVEGVPALQLEVVDLEDPIEVGGDLVYEVRVKNQGSGPCTNIQILANVPDGLQFREANGPVNYRPTATGVVFDPLPKLASKADVVYRIKVKGVAPGDYRFKVQLTCEQLRQPVNKEESSRVYKD
jgi:uncharacterized repeat protein (TIGR01451 family)